MKLKLICQNISLTFTRTTRQVQMIIDEYRELTNRVFNAIRNFETCSSKRDYALSVVSQISYEASQAQCQEADRIDLEQMDFALQLVLDLIQDNPIPEFTQQQFHAALH